MWSYVPLEKVANICDGLRKPVNSKERAKRIEGKLNESLFPYYGATGQVGYIDDYLTDGEYVLLGEDGAPFLNPFASKAYIISGKAWVNNHAHILQSKSNNKFLCYYLNYFDYNSYVSGTTRLKLTQAQLKRIEIPDISKDEQQRIVSCIEELFSELDKGVKTLQTIKEQLAVYRQAVLTSLYPEMTEENTVSLDAIADITSGITKGRKLDGQDTLRLPYLRVANVQNGYLNLSEMKSIELKPSEREKYLLKYGDVLYTEGGDRDKLGRGTIWRDEIKECVHQNHVFKARVDTTRALPKYVSYWSMSTPARNYFYTKGKQSVNLASINKTILSALLLPLPDKACQEKIVNCIEERFSLCDNIEQTVDNALTQAESMRKGILKKAFEGELCK